MEDAKRRKLNEEVNDATVEEGSSSAIAASVKKGESVLENSAEGSTVDDVIAAVSEAAAAEAVKEEAGNNPQNVLHPGENSSPASPSRKGKL